MFKSLIEHALMNKLRRLSRQRTLQVDGRFPHFYDIVFQGLRLQASTRNRIRCVFKKFKLWRAFPKVFGCSVRFGRIRVDTQQNVCRYKRIWTRVDRASDIDSVLFPSFHPILSCAFVPLARVILGKAIYIFVYNFFV